MKSTLQKVIFKHEVRYSYIRIDFQEDNELHPPYLANPEAEIAILTRKARIVLLRSCCECVTRGCLFLVVHCVHSVENGVLPPLGGVHKEESNRGINWKLLTMETSVIFMCI